MSSCIYKEPHEFCMSCDTLLPLSQLQKHVAECCTGAATDRYVMIVGRACLYCLLVLLNIDYRTMQNLDDEKLWDGSTIYTYIATR